MPARELVNPNFHVVLIHFPIALLLTGTLIELFSFLGWRTSGFRIAGRWMILLGALLAIPTAFAGLYALSDVVRMQNPAPLESTWSQTLSGSPVVRDPEGWAMLQRHAFLNGGIVILLGLVVVVWLSGSDEWRRKIHLPMMVLLVLGVGATVVSAWYGGEMVYRRGIGVMEGKAMSAVPPELAPSGGSPVEEILEQPATSPAALSPSAAEAPAAPRTAQTVAPQTSGLADHPAAEAQTDIKRDIERALPPLQMHVVLAGFSVSFALAALGLSLRAANTARAAMLVEPPDELSDLAAAYGARPVRPRVGPDPGAFDEGTGAAHVEVVDRSRVPSARFWLLTALFALATTGFGWWVLLRSESVQNMWDFGGLWHQHIRLHPRRMVHVIGAGAIVLLPLLLAIIARAAPRKRWLIFAFALLLILAVALQVWLGILMMWDTPEGPWQGFNG
ncbi:MAG TPA: DUF2231 domain-containing protein [Tepidisphaeraceae bacterium]|nr:DUF2231 domain-containing protein [Tepidisphaeraceae bacterium]